MNRISGAILAGVFCAGLMACGGGGSGNGGIPMLNLSTQSLLFGAFVSAGTNPAPATVNVTNTGSGILMFSASSDSPWLNVTPASGTAPTTLQISAALGAPPLMAGTYIGHITLTAIGAQGSPGMITVTFTVGSGVASASPFWAQWGANPQHTGMVSVAGQSVSSQLVDIVYDPFVNQEKAENTSYYGEAALTVHEQAPITDGNDVYMEMKTGTYNSCNPVGAWTNGAACGPNTWNTMWWDEARYSWLNGQLLKVWDFESDWVPEPNATNFSLGFAGLAGVEPVFHPVDTPNFIYVPGAQGAIWKVIKTTGVAASHITPSFTGANVTPANTFVSSPLTADSSGNIYYNVIALNPTGGNPWAQNDVAGAWLVKVTPTDAASMVSYATLIPGAPAGTARTCPGGFWVTDPNQTMLPWPPNVNVQAGPLPAPCGSQRPGVNIAPVVGTDGTIYTASRAHFNGWQAYIVAVKPDLSGSKWVAPLFNVLNDGCGVILPISGPANNNPNSCRNGTTVGVDPTTNAPGSALIVDEASSSPTVLPDNSVVFAAVDNYNFGRGHLFHYSSTGQFINAYTFGWDSTPAVYTNGAHSSLIIKDNHYQSTAYCSNTNSPICVQVGPGPYYITQVDPTTMLPEWQFQSTTVDADHPNGYEWCINMPAVDMNGNVYVNSEDGNIYEVPQGNAGIFLNPTGKLFLNLAIGAAYTPVSVGPDGKVYTQNNGHLFAVGN